MKPFVVLVRVTALVEVQVSAETAMDAASRVATLVGDDGKPFLPHDYTVQKSAATIASVTDLEQTNLQ